MKNQLAALELKVLVSELQQLAGSRLERIYDLQVAGFASPGKSLAFQLSKSDLKAFLVCIVPMAIYSSALKPSVEVSVGGFCSLLRHHLDNSRLLSIGQRGSERILEMVFSSKTGTLRLVVELFSKGNILLLDEAGIIIGVAESQKWSDRTIRPGFKYSLPPATADFMRMDDSDFKKAILSSEKDSVVKALAAGLGLSGAYAEELCSSALIDKSKNPQHLSVAELQALYSSLQQLLSRALSPVAVFDDDGKVSQAFPFPVAAVATARTQPFKSFNEAVEALCAALLEASVSASRESPFARQAREMEIALEQQKATIAEMEKVAAEATAAAEALYLHYVDVKQILDDYNRLRKSFTPEQLREYFKANKKVISIDEKSGRIVLWLESPVA